MTAVLLSTLLISDPHPLYVTSKTRLVKQSFASRGPSTFSIVVVFGKAKHPGATVPSKFGENIVPSLLYAIILNLKGWFGDDGVPLNCPVELLIPIPEIGRYGPGTGSTIK
jgi:hypothetical protein